MFPNEYLLESSGESLFKVQASFDIPTLIVSVDSTDVKLREEGASPLCPIVVIGSPNTIYCLYDLAQAHNILHKLLFSPLVDPLINDSYSFFPKDLPSIN